MKNIETAKIYLVALLLAVFSVGPAAARAGGAPVNLSGFVDASYTDMDGSDSSFSLDEVELDIEKTLADGVGLRADLNYREVDDDDGQITFSEVVEQGYLTYTLKAGTGITLTAGKFNAPIGFELLDPVDMYQYSHALVFNYGLPTNLTGLMGAYAFTDRVDLRLYVVNGWDNNTDNNSGKALGGRLGITPLEGVSLGLSAISGTVESAGNTTDKKTVLDADLTITVVEGLTIGGELNLGSQERASAVVAGQDAEWAGALVMAHYDFNDTFGFTLRYDWFDDKDGSRLGNSVKETQQAFTIAPTVTLGEGAGLLVEYRRDTSDQLVFDNNTADDSDTVAVEFTYSF